MAAAAGDEHSGLRLHDSRRKLKSVSITGTYINPCVDVYGSVEMYPADDGLHDV